MENVELKTPVWENFCFNAVNWAKGMWCIKIAIYKDFVLETWPSLD